MVRGDFRAPIPRHKKSCFPVRSHAAATHLCCFPVLAAAGRDSWDVLDPGVLSCSFHASSAINSTLVLQSFFLSLSYDVSRENCFFPPSCQSKKCQSCSIFCYIYIIYKYIYKCNFFFFPDLQLQEYSFASFSLTKPGRILCCFPSKVQLFFHLLRNFICKSYFVFWLGLTSWTSGAFMTSLVKKRDFSSLRKKKKKSGCFTPKSMGQFSSQDSAPSA